MNAGETQHQGGKGDGADNATLQLRWHIAVLITWEQSLYSGKPWRAALIACASFYLGMVTGKRKQYVTRESAVKIANWQASNTDVNRICCGFIQALSLAQTINHRMKVTAAASDTR